MDSVAAVAERAKQSISLTAAVSLLIALQIGLNLVYSTRPQILGFATDIRAEDLIVLTNRERQKRGLAPLKQDTVLMAAARQKAEYMFNKDFWAHVAPDGTTPWEFFKSAGYGFDFAGENLARDFNTSGGVVTAWMNSGSHRDNMLNGDFEEIGIAVVNGMLGGRETTLVVQFLGKPAARAGAEVATAFTAHSLEAALPAGEVVKPAGIRAAWAKPSFAAVKDLGPTKITYLPLLFVLGFVFLLDSAVLLRRRQVRVNGHSMLHALGLGLSAGMMLFMSRGAIL